MNAAVNNGKDEPPFDVAMRGLVAQYGLLRVLLAALRQAVRPSRPVRDLGLSAHLRRDIGLPPDDAA